MKTPRISLETIASRLEAMVIRFQTVSKHIFRVLVVQAGPSTPSRSKVPVKRRNAEAASVSWRSLEGESDC